MYNNVIFEINCIKTYTKKSKKDIGLIYITQKATLTSPQFYLSGLV